MSLGQLLRTSSIFSTLASRDLADLEASATSRTLRRGELLDRSSSGRQWLYLVGAGRLRVLRLAPSGRQLTLRLYQPGQGFWLTSLRSTGEPRSQVEALTKGTVIHLLVRTQVLDLASIHPAFATALIAALDHELGEALDRLEDMALYPVDVHLAHLLPRLTSSASQRDVASTHAELAGLVCTSRDQITKGLGRLRTAGLIARRHHRRGIWLLQPRRLREL